MEIVFLVFDKTRNPYDCKCHSLLLTIGENGISTRYSTTAKISTSVEIPADVNELGLKEQIEDHRFSWLSRMVQNLQLLRDPAHTEAAVWLSLRISSKIYWQWISGACIYRKHIQMGSTAVLGGTANGFSSWCHTAMKSADRMASGNKELHRFSKSRNQSTKMQSLHQILITRTFFDFINK